MRPRMVIAVYALLIVASMVIAACGVSVESEPSEAHASSVCGGAAECSEHTVRLLEEIREIDKELLEGED